MPEIFGALLVTDEELELLELVLELDELDELELEEVELELELDVLELELEELELDDVPLLLTVMLKAGSERLAMPSLTLMTMLEYTATVVGTPVSSPVDELKLAHAGLLLIVNSKGSPGVSLTVGWNRYTTPTVAVVGGVPLIFGITLCQRNGVPASAALGKNETVSSTSNVALKFLKNCMQNFSGRNVGSRV